jgi:dCMP deaminase
VPQFTEWDRRFLSFAEFVAGWSKDPSTKVGAVIADGKRVVSVGFNGFPAGCDDSPELYADRETKYRRVVHAELNAVLFAGRSLIGCTAYTWPFAPCPRCAAVLIQVGVRRVVAPVMPAEIAGRWAAEVAESRRLFDEAGVTFLEV